MTHRSCWLALAFVAGCHTSSSEGAGAHGATSSSVAVASPTPPSSAAATATATTAAAAPTPQPPGEPGVLRLASGATLAMPQEARASELKNAAQRLPGVVKAAHKYELGGEKRLLLVNEMDREGLACDAVLDRELTRANKAQADTDEQKRALRQVKGITELKLGEHRALYAVSANRAPTPGGGATDTSKPMMGVATLMMCQNDDYVVIMHATDQTVSAEDTKKMLVTLAASYKPAG